MTADEMHTGLRNTMARANEALVSLTEARTKALDANDYVLFRLLGGPVEHAGALKFELECIAADFEETWSHRRDQYHA